MKPTRHALMMERIKSHGEYLLKIYPHATDRDPIALCKKLRKLEIKAERACEDLCNGVEPTQEGRIERLLEATLKRVYTLLAIENELPQVFLNRDPRGYALKISDKDVFSRNLDIYRDIGGNGIIAPDFSI